MAATSAGAWVGMTAKRRINPASFSARHPGVHFPLLFRHSGPGSVIPDLIRDRDDGPGVHASPVTPGEDPGSMLNG
jgi:hypothetical protein